jgi:cytochrome c oxidase cbb3-type subunit 3
MKRSTACIRGLAFIAAIIAPTACYREERQLQPSPAGVTTTGSLRLSDLQPGQALPKTEIRNRHEENAYAVSQGKKWFRAYNCSGCHAQGGGSIGPALTDDKWVYGHEPASIYATIWQGRPNGMPSFGGHIPDDQIWQLVAYVRSMSGQLRSDVAPSRNDSLQASEPEQRREKQEPKPSSLPPASTQ